MKKTTIHDIEILYLPGSPLPVRTAAELLGEWLAGESGIWAPVRETPLPLLTSSGEEGGLTERFQVWLGTLDQTPIRQMVEKHHLPQSIQSDGYVLAQFDNVLLIYSQVPRGVIYGCSYELPRNTRFESNQVYFDFEMIQEEPLDDLRVMSFWAYDYSFLPRAVYQYRMNHAWMESKVSWEARLPEEPALHPYIAAHEEEISRERANTAGGLALAKTYGMEAFPGGLNSLWQLPPYLYEGLAQVYPETIAASYRGGSEWTPYEWQDRPQLCFKSPVLRRIYTSILKEYFTAHPDAAGMSISLGYDGYPLGCGCEQCRDYEYADRFRDQILLVYDVVVKQLGKKLMLWTWVVGGASSIPGYEHYYGWVKTFAEANPESVIVLSFATEGDFNITHRLNPVIGTRGKQDLGNVLLWPEYRGDGVVPAWLVDWMAESLPAYRKQGARGFLVSDVSPQFRQQDPIQAAEFYAFGELTWKELSAQEVALDYCARTFGKQSAPYLAAALRKSSEVIRKTLYLPSGPRFSGHSHIEEDLRIFWDVYTLYDSAPFFLDEAQRAEILKAGPPYQPKIEAALPGLAISDENVAAILEDKNEAVNGAEWMLAQVVRAEPYMNQSMYEQIHTRITWLRDYARLFRGLAQAFFHLRLGRQMDGEKVIAGAVEMEAAMSTLPQDGQPLPYGLFAQFGGYPWMITPPFELINSLKAAGGLLSGEISGKPVGIFGCEEAAAALDSLYLPYQRGENLREDLAQYSVLILGAAFMHLLPEQGDQVTKFVQAGGGLLLYNPTENWQSLPAAWLPGRVQPWVCNHPTVQVTQPAHPIVVGYRELRACPISRFQATSALVSEAMRFAPFIKSFVTVSDEWNILTYPSALAETAWGRGRIVIDLIPENRVILLRSLTFLLQPGL